MSKISLQQAASAILIVGLTILVVLLVYENRKLKEQLEYPGGLPVSLVTADEVETVKVFNLKGDSVDISFKNLSNKSILFIFSTTCPSCSKSITPWRDIAVKAKQKGYNVLGVSVHNLEKTKEYVKSQSFEYPVYIVRDTTFRYTHKVTTVPQTIIVRKDGRVQQNWIGLIDSVKQKMIISQL